jgi:hypothetical protein
MSQSNLQRMKQAIASGGMKLSPGLTPMPIPAPPPQLIKMTPVAPPADPAEPKPKQAKKPKLSKVKKLDGKQLEKGRLPNGSEIKVRYNAEVMEWHGELVVPMPPTGEPYTFAGNASGVFKLLSKLDGMYRKILADKEKENG